MVYLVGRTGKSTKETRETRQTGQTRETSKGPRGVQGKRIRRRLIAEGTAVGTEGIVQAIRLEGASGPEGIGHGLRIKRIRAQLAEIFGMDGEREEQEEKDNPPGEPPTSGSTSGLSLLPARRSAQTLR